MRRGNPQHSQHGRIETAKKASRDARCLPVRRELAGRNSPQYPRKGVLLTPGRKLSSNRTRLGPRRRNVLEPWSPDCAGPASHYPLFSRNNVDTLDPSRGNSQRKLVHISCVFFATDFRTPMCVGKGLVVCSRLVLSDKACHLYSNLASAPA